MLSPFIGQILTVSGFITGGGGIAALLYPSLLLRLVFGVEGPTSSALFFVRHWGVLIVAVAALILDSVFQSGFRAPVLIVAAVEKFAIGLLVFFGPVKRTVGMTAIAIVDSIFAILYVVYLVAG